MDASARFLLPASRHAQQLADRAQQAAAAVDVLTAQQVTEAAEAEERAARRGLKVRATDLALQRIVEKLETIPAGSGNLDTLVRTATALDPDQQKSQQGTTVQVAVMFRQEGRAEPA